MSTVKLFIVTALLGTGLYAGSTSPVFQPPARAARPPAAIRIAPQDDAGRRDWYNPSLAEEAALFDCGLISDTVFKNTLDADAATRERFDLLPPNGAAVDAELATLQLHSCDELAQMPFARLAAN